MNLRCRPGDKAIVIEGRWSGAMLRCLSIHGPTTRLVGAPFWLYESLSHFLPSEKLFCISDACLRPLRDPGPDAVDEILQRVPSPAEAA